MTLLRTCLAALLGLMLGANVLAQNGGSSTMLDTLFAKLQTATDPVAIQSLEAAIWEQWIVVPDGPQRELMMRGIAEMQQRQLKQSVETFSKLIEIAPDLSEAWNKRATALLAARQLPGLAQRHLRDGEARAAPFRRLFRSWHDPRGNGRVSARRRRLRAGARSTIRTSWESTTRSRA